MQYSSHTANLLLDSIKDIIGVENIQGEIQRFITSNMGSDESVDIRGNSIYYTAAPDIDLEWVTNACQTLCTKLFNQYTGDICEANHLIRHDLEEIENQHNLISRMYMIVKCSNTYEIIV